MTDNVHMPAELLDVIRHNGLDSVEGAFSFPRAADLTRPGLGHRRYFRLELEGRDGRLHVMYMKRYGREPFTWRLRRLITYGWGKSPAGVEMANVRAAKEANLPAIQYAYYNHESDLFGARRSYIILSPVPGVALEHCGQSFLDRHWDHPEVLEGFTDRLAELVASLHRGGYVHRDLYTSHIYLDESEGDIKLWLIDLARMFRPRCCLFRWRVKDLSQLRYSMPPGWTAKYWQRFLAGYLLGVGAAKTRPYARAVERKERRIRRRLEAKRRTKGS